MESNDIEKKEEVTKKEKERDRDFCGTIVDPNLYGHDVTITKLIYDDPNSIERDESE